MALMLATEYCTSVDWDMIMRCKAHPETPATLSSFRMSVGGKTISFSIAVSIVIGWPSSSISSMSCMSACLRETSPSLDSGVPCIQCQSYP